MTPEPPLLVILPAPEIFTFNVCCWTEELLEEEEDDELLDELLEDFVNLTSISLSELDIVISQ